MRRGYNSDIRTEAITQRLQNKEWLEIQDALDKKFKKKPSIRQMQQWVEDYKGTTDDPTGVRYLAKAIEDAANLAKPLAQINMMKEVVPAWTKIQLLGVLPEDAPYVAYLYFLEIQLGRDKVDRIIDEYSKVRNKMG